MLEGILINGLVRGGVYALLAIGFSLIFGVARMINMAFTSFYMLAAYGIYTFSSLLGVHPLVAMLISLVLTTLIGIATYKIFIDRVREHHVTVMLITMAVAMIYQEFMLMAFGGHYLAAPTFLEGYLVLLGVKVSYQHLLTFGVVLVVLLGVWALLSKTRLGIAIRAVAQDGEIANLMGINVSRILLVTMAIASALAAISGVVVAPTLVLEPYMWTHPLIMVMAIVVLGGMGSQLGVILAAVALTVLPELARQFQEYRMLVFGLLLVLVMLWRPQGLLPATRPRMELPE